MWYTLIVKVQNGVFCGYSVQKSKDGVFTVKVCGVVCEYNPFHNGHRLQIERLRDMGYAVVCVMSGSFVERGEPAILPKQLRAESALASGADLVLELPFPFSCFGAERFALCGVSVMKSCGFINAIAFGSECADLALLSKASDFLLTEEFSSAVRERMKSDRTLGYARARSAVLCEKVGIGLTEPNDILGAEYLKALKKLRADGIVPIVLPRTGASHNGTYSESECVASASYIRQKIKNGEASEIVDYVTPETAKSLKFCEKADRDLQFKLTVSSIILHGEKGLSDIAEIPDGFESILYGAALHAANMDELESAVRSKHITDTKIRRMLLFALTGVTKSDMASLPLYTRVIASNEEGYRLLKLAKSTTADGFALISAAKHLANASPAAKRQFERNNAAERIFSLIKKQI